MLLPELVRAIGRLGIARAIRPILSNVAHFEVNGAPARAGFFWYRRTEPSWQTVKTLLGESHLSWINIHQARDPLDSGPPVIPDDDEARYQLRFTQMSDDKFEYTRTLHEAGIFFAPRLQEGIGMAFLESMAMGKAVVAADNPTMNEYIPHQVNGYLFDPDNPAPLDLSRFQEIGRAARQSMERGNLRWERSRREIKEWVVTGVWPRLQPASPRRSCRAPSISVIVLSTGNKEAAKQTRLSIESQSHAPLEHNVVSAHHVGRRADILNHAAASAKAEWLIFLEAGTLFRDENVISDGKRFTGCGLSYLPLPRAMQWA